MKLQRYRLLVLGLLAFVSFFSSAEQLKAQDCGFGPGLGCPGTDYTNCFFKSTTNRNTIEYDNFISAFHTTLVRDSVGDLITWGEVLTNTGAGSNLVPFTINSTNFPALTGTRLRATVGSSTTNNTQGIVLTTTGLFAMAQEGRVIDATITAGTGFQPITIGGNPTGLPPGVLPDQVKMMTASSANGGIGSGVLVLTLCSGDVWVLAANAAMRGNGSTGNALTWSRVTTNAVGNPFLSGIVACRTTGRSIIALEASGALWTWGQSTWLGNGTAIATRNRATPMTLPAFNPGASAKMISITSDGLNQISYYVLATDDNLYALGNNASRQLGDWTTTDRNVWVQPRYTGPAGPVMNDIKWITANEHCGFGSATINVLTNGSQIYNWGLNLGNMLGRAAAGAAENPAIPNFIAPTDVIIAANTGGHTSMYVKKCMSTFGYVGHRINGSMGNGSAAALFENVVTYATASVPICGAYFGVDLLGTVGASNAADSSSHCAGTVLNMTFEPAGGSVTTTGPATYSSGLQQLTMTAGGTVNVIYNPPVGCTVPRDSVTYFSICESVSSASATPTLCNNTALTSITHITICATGIGAPIGLPPGVTATWAANVLTISGTPTSPGVFNYSIPVVGACGGVSATGTITVIDAPTVAAAGPDQTGAGTCGTTSTTLAANTPTVGTGIWTIVAGVGGTVVTPGSPTSVFNGVAGNTYTLRWTVTNAPCPASFDEVDITFNLNPTVASAGADQTGAATCGTTSTNLAANTPTVGTGTWTIVAGVGGTIVTPGSPTSVFNGVAGNTYTLRWTITNAPCPASFDEVDITFNLNPMVAAAGADQTGAGTCGTTSTTLAANTPTVGTGAWTIVAGVGGTIVTPASPTSVFNGVAGNTYTLRWTITNAPCPASFDEVDITFNLNPTVAAAGADQTGAGTCGTTSTTLAANTPTVGTGTWTIVAGVGGTIVTPGSPTSVFNGVAGNTYTVRWTVTNAPCPASFDEVDITFNLNPTVASAGADQTGAATCGTTSTTLAANTPTVGTGTWTIVAGVGGTIVTLEVRHRSSMVSLETHIPFAGRSRMRLVQHRLTKWTLPST